MKKLLILGAGGFGRMIASMAEETGEYETIAFLDDGSTEPRVVGCLEDYPRFAGDYPQALVAMGNNPLRLAYLTKLREAGYETPAFVFRPAYLSREASVGEGSFVLPGAVINPRASAGRGCILNCGCVLDHDAVVGEGAHICLNAVVKAGCRVEPCVKIEAGQVVENH